MQNFLHSMVEVLKFNEKTVFAKDNFLMYSRILADIVGALISEKSSANFTPFMDSFSLNTWTYNISPNEKPIKSGYIFFISDIEGFKSGYVGKYHGALIQTKIHLPSTNDLNYFCESLRNAIPLIINQQVH